MLSLRLPIRRLICLTALIATVSPTSVAIDSGTTRPNILWISCEDISPHLGCYGDPTATTPNLDALAADGIRFTHAFSCHGVCAPSRTGIITGMYPIALGANHMRSKVAMPASVKLFPQLLREAGYYCTNNSKTDYNLVWDQKAVWNESSAKAHWKNRASSDQPFFAVFNLTMTHESKVWESGWRKVVEALPDEERHDPTLMSVPPMYPDTPAIKADFARLADVITVMDAEAGRLLRELDEAGLTDNTIVFFWSDHGDGQPRSKRWTYDSGSRVPLIVRVPLEVRESWPVAGEPGSADDRMVSLTDLGPTVLAAAGVTKPAVMHGKPFLGPDAHPGHCFIYGARDRVDERFDLVRTVRSKRYKYVRNLMPWRSTLQPVTYAEQNATLQELRRLHSHDELPPTAAQWFNPTRPAEELYDLKVDPWELHNVVELPEHAKELAELRTACDDLQRFVRDPHLIPESMLANLEAQGTLRSKVFDGEGGQQRFDSVLEAAKECSRLDPQSAAEVCTRLSDDEFLRWWQVTLIARAPQSEQRLETLLAEVQHSEVAIRIAAAAGLARAGEHARAAECLSQALTDTSEFVRHAALLEIDEAGPSLVSLLKTEVSAAGDSEYLKRLIEHALNLR